MTIADAPDELQAVIRQFWPEGEWDNAAAIAKMESGYDAFALYDSTDDQHPCGSVVSERQGLRVTAEKSVGYFQINVCNFPGCEWQRLYNAYQNAGTAHMLWTQQGWAAWYYSAHTLGLVS